MMLNSDMCLVYRNNERLHYCKLDETDNGSWQNARHECLTNFINNGKDILADEMKCCAWTKLVPLYGKGVLDYIDDQVHYCGIDF